LILRDGEDRRILIFKQPNNSDTSPHSRGAMRPSFA
jgi:hypothetical protein